MIFCLKTLGLALAAVVALSASASAQTTGKITPSTGSAVTLDGTETGSNVNRITFNSSDYTDCIGSKVSGHKVNSTTSPKESVPTGANEITLTANFVNCIQHDNIGTHKSTVTMTTCDFVGHITETTGGVTGTYGFKYDLKCNTAGDSIDIDVYAFSGSELGGIQCTIKIKEQLNLTGAHVTNLPSEDFAITGPLNEIHAERSGSGCSTETTTSAQIDIDATVQGTGPGGESVGVTISH